MHPLHRPGDVRIVDPHSFHTNLSALWRQFFASNSDPPTILRSITRPDGSTYSVLDPELVDPVSSARHPPLVVLDEYPVMYDAMLSMPPVSVLFFTGHAGIGKNFFMMYALFRAVSEGRNIVFSDGFSVYYIDKKTGARKFHEDEDCETELQEIIEETTLCLCTALHGSPKGVPDSIQALQARIAVSSYIEPARFQWARSRESTRYFIVNLPSASDLTAVEHAYALFAPVFQFDAGLAQKLGPGLRAIRGFSDKTYKRTMKTELQSAAANAILPLSNDALRKEDRSYFFYTVPVASLTDRLQSSLRYESIVPTKWLKRRLDHVKRKDLAVYNGGRKGAPFVTPCKRGRQIRRGGD